MNPAAPSSLDLTPLGRAVVVLASLALGAAWTTGSEPARLAACLLIAPLLVDWVCKLRRFAGVSVVVGPRRTRAGSLLLERARLTNSGRRALWQVYLRENGQVLASVRGQGVHVEYVPPGGEREVELSVRARGRDVAPMRAFVLSTTAPLGLVQLTTTVVTAAPVVSEPARVRLPAFVARQGDEGAAALAHARGQDEETFYALRELRDGEHYSRVHALRSGAVGTPVRVLRRGARPCTARVLLDLRAPPGRVPQRSNGQAFEWGLSAAASLVEEFAGRGQACDLVVQGSSAVTFRSLGAHGDLRRFLDCLAAAKPQRHAPASETTLQWLTAGGDAFWIIAGGFAAVREREQVGQRLQVLEWTG